MILEQKLYGHLKNITTGHSRLQYLNAHAENLKLIYQMQFGFLQTVSWPTKNYS
jgi:hypothetical protein